MSEVLIRRGHKRPLPPPHSREAVLQELNDEGQWETIDDDLYVCEPSKRQKSDYQDSLGLDLGSSILRTPAKAVASHTADQELVDFSKDTSPSQDNTYAVFQYKPRSALKYQSNFSGSERRNCVIDEKHGNKINQIETDKEDEEDVDQEATRLAQLVNVIPEATEPADTTVTNIPESDFVKKLKAQAESEGRERSRINRAAQLELRARSDTVSNSTFGIASISNEQSNVIHQGRASPPKGTSLHGITRLPSTVTFADDADNERLLDIAQLHSLGQGYDVSDDGDNGQKDIHPHSRLMAKTVQSHHFHGSNFVKDETERKLAMHEAGNQRLLKIMEEVSMQASPAPRAEFINRPFQIRASTLNQMISGNYQDVANSTDNCRRPKPQSQELTDATMYPQQGENVELPNNLDRMTEEMQDIIKQQQICKIRTGHLSIIPSVMHWIATAGSAKAFNAVENTELREARTYLNKVLEEGLCGSKRRNRMASIRDNMKRRADNLPTAPKREIDTFHDSIFPPALRERLKTEQAELEEKVKSLGDLRKLKKKAKARNPSKCAASIEESEHSSTARVGVCQTNSINLGQSGLEAPPAVKSKSVRKRIIRRLTPTDSLEEREARLRVQLKAFDDQDDIRLINTENITDKTLGHSEDNTSEISEEDGGASYYTGTRIVEEGSTNIITPHEQSHTHEGQQARPEDRQSLPSSQQPHEGLREELEKKKRSTQRLDIDLVHQAKEKTGVEDLATGDGEAESEALCDDSDVSESDDEDRFCYRYHINLCATGIECFDDTVEYRQNTFLRLDKANDQAAALIKEVMTRYMPDTSTASKKSWIKSEEYRDGLVEYNIALGRDHETLARIWVEQEEYSVSNQAYEDARFKRACRPKPVYFVMWERTVRRWVERSEVHEDDIDLGEMNEAVAEKVIDKSETTNLVERAKEDASVEDMASSDTIQTSDDQDQSSSMSEPDDDELFGPLSPRPVDDAMETSSESTLDDQRPSPPAELDALGLQGEIIFVERPSLTDIVTTSDIALANRLAKERFVIWWKGHLQGSDKHAYIRHEEAIMEEEIKSYTNKTSWTKEDQFLTKDYRDGTKESDELKVWVQEKKVLGPAN